MSDTNDGRVPRKSPWPAAAAAGLVALLLAACWCVSCPDTLTLFEWKYRYRVHEGMSLAEVESVLGPGRPGKERRAGEEDVVRPGEMVRFVDRQSYYWQRGGMWIRVTFRGGRADSKSFSS